MLQHHLFGDFEALELIGREVIPEVGTPRARRGFRATRGARRRERPAPARSPPRGHCATRIPAATSAAPPSSAAVSGSPSTTAPNTSAPNGRSSAMNEIVTAGSSRQQQGRT